VRFLKGAAFLLKALAMESHHFAVADMLAGPTWFGFAKRTWNRNRRFIHGQP
jgi:hypothetical protein